MVTGIGELFVEFAAAELMLTVGAVPSIVTA
jgi:hypothetical protein